MALVNNGLKISLSAGQIPAGISTQTVDEFTDHEYFRTESLSVLKSTVENGNKATTFDNVLNNTSIGVKKQIDDLMEADYIDSNKVTYY